MRHIFVKAAFVTMTCAFAIQAAAQPKYISTRQQMDQEIFAQAEDLRASANKKKKRTKTSAGTTQKVSLYKPKKTRKKTIFSNDINYAVATTGAGASQNASSTVMPTDSRISTKAAKPEEAKSEDKLGGNVALTFGHDSDYLIDRLGDDATFFEIAPSLGYESKHFDAKFGARIKDFTTQEASDQAKETEANVGFAAKFGSDIKSKTTLDFTNSDSRWRDFFNETVTGMPIRYFQSKLGQSFGTKIGALSLDANASILFRDHSNSYTDNVSPILGARIYDRDFIQEQVDGRVGVELSKNVTVAGRPVFKHRKYIDEPARQTDGTKGGAAFAATTPEAEVMTAELNVDFITTFGPVGITPTATVGQDSDRALGAEDSSYTGGKLALAIDLDKDTGLQLTASGEYKDIKFDNWTKSVTNGALRHDTESTTSVGAAVNILKSVKLALDYALVEEKSNIPAIDENYRREIIGTTVTVSF